MTSNTAEKATGLPTGGTTSNSDANCCAAPLVQITPSPAKALAEVKLLAALADATRLQIVAMLAGLEEPLCVCDIQSHFKLGQPTISHHLRVLRDAGMVSWEKRGLWVYYSLNSDTLARAAAYLNNLLPGSQKIAG